MVAQTLVTREARAHKCRAISTKVKTLPNRSFNPGEDVEMNQCMFVSGLAGLRCPFGCLYLYPSRKPSRLHSNARVWSSNTTRDSSTESKLLRLGGFRDS